ncbi:MAG: proprotein convertase P-domain-containing protein [Deltaproteobacteria bacterium]|nr:proprotein convertase P-domain-containing protein [Deltaproteobacteria bacterium]
MKTTKILLSTLLLSALVAPRASLANANDRFGETRVDRLHPEATMDGGVLLDGAQVSKVPWVGSWWAYKNNGIANCWDVSGADDCYEDTRATSPSEKLDEWLGRTDKIDRADVKAYLGQTAALDPLTNEKRDLITKINRWMASNPDGNWREQPDGIRYLEVVEEIKNLQNSLPAVNVDTATEWEILNHGQGVPGVGGWWGHCNAWSAAAIMDPEPRVATTVGGIEFTPADVKGYLAEAWMEQRSSFHGSRANEDPWDKNSDGKTDWADTEVAYKDLTPASFHIFLADQIGNKDKSFVIDRYTGDQVWNQPMRAYQTRMEPLYEGETAMKRQVKQTSYSYNGTGSEKDTGEKDVYPVLVTTTFHWITDGLPHNALNVAEITHRDDRGEFADSWAIRRKYDDQVEIRTLTYELWLSRPLGDEKAQIIGDGEWKHGSMIGNQNHPDFAWQPQGQSPSQRDYENPYVPYDRIVSEILPNMFHTVAPTPTPGGLVKQSTEAQDIPDNDSTGITSEIEVSEDVEITSLVVVPNITHTYRGDLEITLRKGRRWKTIKRKGEGGSADDLKDPIDVPHYIGDTTAGTWRLQVKDRAGQDVGKLEGWQLIFNQ